MINLNTTRKRAVLASLLSAFVWPGAGQLYNREMKKGWLLIATSILVGLGFLIKMSASLQDLYPQEAIQKQLEAFQSSHQGPGQNVPDFSEYAQLFMVALKAYSAATRPAVEQLLKNPPDYFRYCNLFMTALWAYSVVDAFLGARSRHEIDDDEIPPTEAGPTGDN